MTDFKAQTERAVQGWERFQVLATAIEENIHRLKGNAPGNRTDVNVIQHCKFRRTNPAELSCENCGATVAAATDNVMRVCDIEADDPPECDPSAIPCALRGGVLGQLKANAPGCRHEAATVYACPRAGCCTLEIKVAGMRACAACPEMQLDNEPLNLGRDGWRMPIDARLKMHVVVSPQFESLYADFFLPSLERLQDDGLSLVVHRVECEGNGDFGTDGYVDALRERCRIVANVLREIPSGEAAIFSDVDIAFLGRFREQIESALLGADVVFMNEFRGSPPHIINFGFFAARAIPEVIAFVERCGHECSATMHDQDVARRILKGAGFAWKKLSDEFSNTNLRTTDRASADVLYHAIGTQPRNGKSSIVQKRELLGNALASRLSREAVVARYNESAEWIRTLPIPIALYDKSPVPIPDAVRLDNVGREADTYTQHILRHYNSLAAVTYFLQGNPFDHSPGIMGEFRQPMPDSGFRDLGATVLLAKPGYVEMDGATPLADAWEFLFPACEPLPLVRFGAGAQFAVTRERIRLRPAGFYERVHEVSLWEWGPWLLERLWPVIFSDFGIEDPACPA